MSEDEKILHEIYRRSFAASTPKGDWDELLINAEVDEDGRRTIPYMDYECDMETMSQILDEVLSEFEVPDYRYQAFSTSFWLGCGPKTSRKKSLVRKNVKGLKL